MKSTKILLVTTLVMIVASAWFEGASANGADTLAPFTPPLRGELIRQRFVADVDDAAALYVNPAGLGARKNSSTLLQLTYSYNRLTELPLAVSFPGLGLGYMYQNNEFYRSNSYSLGLGFPLIRQFYIGTSLNWHHTDLEESRSPFSVDVGFLTRPHRYLSLGGVWHNTNRPRFHTGRLEDFFTGGISIRPMTERFTISGQGTFDEGAKPAWLIGGRLAIVPGLELFGSYERDYKYCGDDPYEEFTAGLRFTFAHFRTSGSTRSRIGGDFEYNRNTLTFEKSSSFFTEAIYHKKRYAEITLSGNYIDEGRAAIFAGGNTKNLHRILRELENVRKDPDVHGLLLKIGALEGAFIGPVTGNLCEIREAVKDVRKAGKPVVAYLVEQGMAAELYIASATDVIVAPREAPIGMIAVSLELNRLKRLFAKLGIDWDWYTAGDYKSTFHTPYTDTTTALQEEELRSLVEESYRLLVEAIGEGRGISKQKMLEIADGRVYMHEDAVKIDLVDVVGWEDNAREELGKLTGAREPRRIRTTSIARRKYWTERWKPAPVVAVVGAYGSIRSGKSKRDIFRGGRTMGSRTIVKQLSAAAGYPGVKAIVFRVDSGGGSALASDEILKEIRRIQREVKIPVIISMGNIAGSGGYWISMYGDAVFADPFTITGSIGVVFAKPVLQRLYEKIGVTNEVFKVGEHADALSARRMMTEEERGYLGELIDGMYEYFIEQVAEGRKMDPDEVRKLAGGRVYFGTQALEINLVDRIGGLKDAVEYAAEESGIADDYRMVYFRAFPPSFFNLDMGGTALNFMWDLKKLWPLSDDHFDESLTMFK